MIGKINKAINYILNKTENYHLISIFFISFFVRFIYSIIHIKTYGINVGFDAGDYIQFSNAIISQGWLVLDVSNIASHSGPGYPIILVIDKLLFGSEKFYFSIFVGILFNSLSPLIVYKISNLMYGNVRLSIFASLWAVFYLHFIRYAPFIGKESIIFFLFPLCIYIGINNRIHIYKRILIFILSYNWLIHIDERYFLFLPLFLVLIADFRIQNFKYTFLTFCLLGLAMLPWTYRNYLVFERPLILTERSSKIIDPLFNYIEPVNEFRDYKKNYYKTSDILFYEDFCDSLVQGLNPSSKNLRGGEVLKSAISSGYIPKTYSKIEHYWYEFLELMRPFKFRANFTANGYRFWPEWKFMSNLVYSIQYGSVLVFSILGFYHLFYDKEKYAIILLLMLILHISFHVFIWHTVQRYRVPMDFIFIIVGLRYFSQKIKFNFRQFF